VYLARYGAGLEPVIVARGVDNWPDSAPLYPTSRWTGRTMAQSDRLHLPGSWIQSSTTWRRAGRWRSAASGTWSHWYATCCLIGRVEHMQVQRAVRAVRLDTAKMQSRQVGRSGCWLSTLGHILTRLSRSRHLQRCKHDRQIDRTRNVITDTMVTNTGGTTNCSRMS